MGDETILCFFLFVSNHKALFTSKVAAAPSSNPYMAEGGELHESLNG